MPEAVISKYETQLFVVKIGGAAISDDLAGAIKLITVDTSLHMPDMFTIRFYDATLSVIDEATLEPGKPVEILVGNKPLFKGEITTIEPEFSAESSPTVLVRGYDRSHRLHRGRKTRTFVKQTDSDIIQTIAKEAGLQVEVDATSIQHDYLIQNNQTNMEFMLMRAELLGYQIYVIGGKLYFKKGTATVGDAPVLTWPLNLRRFSPRLSANPQTEKTIVLGWDPNTKKAIKSEVTPNNSLKQGGQTKTGGAAAKAAFGSAMSVVVDHPVATVDEAKAIATGIAEQLDRTFLEAEGECYGDPDLKAGKMVEITGVGTRFSGKYFVTTATHIYQHEIYRTTFSISGRKPDSLAYMLGSAPNHPRRDGRVYGLVPGVVTNNKDEKGLGRVKVKFPWLNDPNNVEIESHWARLAMPMAGQNKKGVYYIPEVNDEVLVGFEHGDMRFPYIVGVLWNNVDQPPQKSDAVVSDGKTNQWIIRSRSGHVIILEDTDGQEKITIRDKTEKNFIIINSKENTMSITADKDIAIKAGGNISLNAGGDITMDSKNWTVKTMQNSSVEATQNVSLKATQSGTFEATQKLTLKGSLQAELEGGTMTTVKSNAKVGIQGSAMVEVQGGLIKLN